MKVKLISSSAEGTLQHHINKFLEENSDVIIIDIKLTANSSKYLAMIMYKNAID